MFILVLPRVPGFAHDRTVSALAAPTPSPAIFLKIVVKLLESPVSFPAFPSPPEFAAQLGRKFRCRAGVCASGKRSPRFLRCGATGQTALDFYAVTAIPAIPFSLSLAVRFGTVLKLNTKTETSQGWEHPWLVCWSGLSWKKTRCKRKGGWLEFVWHLIPAILRNLVEDVRVPPVAAAPGLQADIRPRLAGALSQEGWRKPKPLKTNLRCKQNYV